MLMQQKTSCDAMIDEKNKLINDFQQVTTHSLINVSSKDWHFPTIAYTHSR